MSKETHGAARELRAAQQGQSMFSAAPPSPGMIPGSGSIAFPGLVEPGCQAQQYCHAEDAFHSSFLSVESGEILMN